MAPPAMQGVAQQLILDRRVGSYVVPEGWFIWAAGNRKEDRSAVFDMPAPLANRFLHLEVKPDFESFKAYAMQHGVHEQILAFLSFRTTLLHKINPHQPAWPSPRAWSIASDLHHIGLDIAPALGNEAAAEFAAHTPPHYRISSRSCMVRGTQLPFLLNPLCAIRPRLL
ncbi:MAG: MoxR family ATPase [Chloroflexi bacterium AL-W]|nr:MoxR family ATPase [Chloroflexi bacterium AL-N1]NOK66288.1 MoxR family ATPase [Chloroflexi bacterium AL-N10]NOK73168.1 MoxR family ATPase [Chloroflexi bacterium AL-N5]NOK80065.1 MoxR family ATPase [Chloroflexi bacterium AL-W]NOK88080.1 MoxR family ATPase [Chloroflexi bacterium AL-N15]